jgi:hypothetical protein
MSPVAWRNPSRTAAPLPLLRGRKWSETSPRVACSRRMSRVPSVEKSSTTTISFSISPMSTARTWSSSVATVERSL